MEILCIPRSRVHTQAKGGVENYDDGEEWQVNEIEALVPRGGEIVAYVGWRGYDRVYNTFEPLVNIVDRTLVTKFQQESNDLITQGLWSMRDEVVAALLGPGCRLTSLSGNTQPRALTPLRHPPGISHQ